MTEPNYCEECKHCVLGADFKASVCYAPIPVFVTVPQPDMYVRRPRKKALALNLPCTHARAYHAGQPNVIDPVPVCPKWAARDE